jgi:hypothetical protein
MPDNALKIQILIKNATIRTSSGYVLIEINVYYCLSKFRTPL